MHTAHRRPTHCKCTTLYRRCTVLRYMLSVNGLFFFYWFSMLIGFENRKRFAFESRAFFAVACQRSPCHASAMQHICEAEHICEIQDSASRPAHASSVRCNFCAPAWAVAVCEQEFIREKRIAIEHVQFDFIHSHKIAGAPCAHPFTWLHGTWISIWSKNHRWWNSIHWNHLLDARSTQNKYGIFGGIASRQGSIRERARIYAYIAYNVEKLKAAIFVGTADIRWLHSVQTLLSFHLPLSFNTPTTRHFLQPPPAIPSQDWRTSKCVQLLSISNMCSIFRCCIHEKRHIRVRINYMVYQLDLNDKCNANCRHSRPHTRRHMQAHNPFKWTHFAVWEASLSCFNFCCCCCCCFTIHFNSHGAAVFSAKTCAIQITRRFICCSHVLTLAVMRMEMTWIRAHFAGIAECSFGLWLKIRSILLHRV